MKSLLLSIVFAFAAGTSLAADPAPFQVKVSGHGQPLILIPGLASSGEVWDATVAHFGERYECHVITLAGFAGTSARPESGPGLEMVVEKLAAYIREHKLAHPIIIGHSLGGFLALDLAAKHPELPDRLVIVDSLPFLAGSMKPDATADDARQLAEGAANAFTNMDAETYARMIRGGPNGSTMAASSTDVERIIAWGLASDRATVARVISELYRADLRPALPSIKSPALVLAAWVGYAPYSSHQIAEQLYGSQYAGLAGVQLRVSDTARHFIMFDDPQWMFTQIEGFLKASNPGVAAHE